MVPLIPRVRNAVQEDDGFAFTCLDVMPGHALLVAGTIYNVMGEGHPVEHLLVTVLVRRSLPDVAKVTNPICDARLVRYESLYRFACSFW
jgi:hypothetical protein